MKKILILLLVFAFNSDFTQNYKSISKRVDSLLYLMTLEEKIGQLNQNSGDGFATRPILMGVYKVNKNLNGQVGSMLNILGVDQTRQYQNLAMLSRHKIPLLFGLDVVHSYKTTFPIPLAEAAS